MPRFSIVVPAYNAAATLGETLESVLGQRWHDWECVVVDDGSTDGTLLLAETYARRDLRVKVVHQENQGSAGAYNTGVRAAAGPLIVMCSADDILLPSHLTAMDAFITRNPGYGIYSTNGEYLYESGRTELVYGSDDWQHELSLSLEDVLACCFFSVGAAYQKRVFDSIGGYTRGVYGEDYDFWLRALATGAKHRYTPEVLSQHRVSALQKSADILRVYRSNILAYRRLIDGGWVQPDQVPLVESAIVARELLMEKVGRQEAARGRAERACLLLSRVVGRRAANRTMTTMLGVRRRMQAWLPPRGR